MKKYVPNLAMITYQIPLNFGVHIITRLEKGATLGIRETTNVPFGIVLRHSFRFPFPGAWVGMSSAYPGAFGAGEMHDRAAVKV